MTDTLIRGATVVDGTGAPARAADVAIVAGRIAAIGSSAAASLPADAAVIEADGLTLTPGFIDIHTHYDAQLFWDPHASPSPLHGVTTVIAGNCGFSLAPVAEGDADYVTRMMAVVEGIPLGAFRAGCPIDWTTFGAFLDRLEGGLGVNAGFLVGHSTLRRAVMGAAATRDHATAVQLAAMERLLAESLTVGALGLSSGSDNVHTDGDGAPVPSRAASFEEFVALARVVGHHPGTTLGMIPWVGEMPRDRMDLMADMSLAAGRPLNWNLLGSMSPTDIYLQQLEACDIARQRGAKVVALTLPDFLKLRVATLIEAVPEVAATMALDDAGRMSALADPSRRAVLRAALEATATGPLQTLSRHELLEIAEARSPQSEPFVGLSVADAAATLGVDGIDVMLDLVVAERLPLSVMLPSLVPSLGASDDGWRVRAEVWSDERVVLGGSDAGAHSDLMCHANYPTVVLGDAVRRRGLLTLEEAVRLMTEVPARLLGLRDRGRIAPGAIADLVLFDPATVASGPALGRRDLPGGEERLYAESVGVARVIVGGEAIVVEGRFTEERPGRVLRSGRDTDTVGLDRSAP